MDRHRFNIEVRPLLQAIPIGKQDIAFDRLHLDTWADKHGNERPEHIRKTLWDIKKCQVLPAVEKLDTSTEKLMDSE